jgi:hypothetical protein
MIHIKIAQREQSRRAVQESNLGEQSGKPIQENNPGEQCWIAIQESIMEIVKNSPSSP